ncbi:MAG: hypothetical protein N2379_08235, partial [Verrucomicrobiae bacterium]|nr:hypothetical protein [Verrucomicrobiae bacterium]
MSLLAQITDESRARGLEFVVIGALAVNVHGLIRDTADLDLLVQQEKREAWLKLLAEFQYTVASERPAFWQLDPPAKG